MAQIFVGILPKVAQVHFSIHKIDKDRLSIRFLAPYSEERKKAAAEQAKRLLKPTIKAEGID